jgi:hypothetical protein
MKISGLSWLDDLEEPDGMNAEKAIKLLSKKQNKPLAAYLIIGTISTFRQLVHFCRAFTISQVILDFRQIGR